LHGSCAGARLKSGAADPDIDAMLVPATAPLDPTPEGLRALYVSLNSPVVCVGGLPVGPAAAAIAVHGSLGTTLLVRSVRTGTVAYFHAEARGGLEAALSHAEGLGFLFDDENLGGEGARVGWPAWLAEIFAAEPECDAEFEAAAWLSKFRWAVTEDGLPL
jgi:hypothetical protein